MTNEVSIMMEDPTGSAHSKQFADVVQKFPALVNIMGKCSVAECEKVASMFLSRRDELKSFVKVFSPGATVFLKEASSMHSLKGNAPAIVVSCDVAGSTKISFEDGTVLSTSSHLLCEQKEDDCDQCN